MTEVETALTALVGSAPDDKQRELNRMTDLLHRLTAPDHDFSAEQFVAAEVASALLD